MSNKEKLIQNNAKIEELIAKLGAKSITNGKYNIEVTIEADGTQTLNITDWNYAPAPSFEPVLANNTPAQIDYVSSRIRKNNYTSAEVKDIFGWDLQTDTLSIACKDGITRTFRIIGFNHDDLSDGTGKAGITFHEVDCEPVKYPMNSSNTNAGGYPSTIIRNETLPTLFEVLPDEWQKVIKPVDKKSNNGGKPNYTETLVTSELLFLLSYRELSNSATSNAYEPKLEGSTYEYWQDKDYDDKIKYYDTTGSGTANTAVAWWLRSCGNSTTGSGTSTKYSSIATTGRNTSSGGTNASSSLGIAYAMCV